MSKYYDLKDVKEMAGGDEDFLKIIVQTFLEEIPPDVNSMNEAIVNGNPSLAYQYAHKMKPNLQLFGLELMEQILTIEGWSKGNNQEDQAKEAGEKVAAKVNLAQNQLKQDFDL
jgi:HPt (histidine-containing phosphotransfer) domain-containing protein